MSRAADQHLTQDAMQEDPDPEVIAILDDYLSTIEQGKPVELDELLARRPDLAGELTAYFDSINFLQLAARDMGHAASTSLFDEWIGRTLGEFEIVRELGRGGMGVVYEATQTKLDRRVALKVLPLAAVLDKQQTARFLLEAQAAAQLSHPHIVPVYDVGYERGVHYYSMRYIEGESLEDAVARLKQREHAPASVSRLDGQVGTNNDRIAADTQAGFSTACSPGDKNYITAVAKLGIQAAEALQHAHDYGVVHRDIKPSNLMIDREGKLWVTDFGLARCQSDASITRTGAVLGTVRYMSPEQAAGRRGLVDHRTDIYSLGATLYELLTLRTPYNADVSHELLRQIERREPIAPRRLNQSIPFDLETIVLKAISKQRRQRYATAQELADDLRRFLAGNSIAARRPSLAERFAKWAARHRNVVAAAVVVALLALVGTTIAVILIAQEQTATAAALSQSQRNFERSQSNFRQSREVLDHFGLLVVDRLAGLPGTERLRSELLRDTLRYYDRFMAQAENDPTLTDLATTCFKSGEILDRLGHSDKALESYQRACRIFERLNGVDVSAQVAACHNNSALVYESQGNADAAKTAFAAAIHSYEQRLDAKPADIDARLQLASTYGNLATLLTNIGQRSESEKYHQLALGLQQQLANDHPDRTDFRRELAMTFNNLSVFHRDDDAKRSAELNQQAIDLLQQINSAEPENIACQSDLALSFTNQGSLLAASRNYEQAEVAYREAIRLYQSLLRHAPNVFAYRRDLAVAHNNLGRTLTELQRYDAAQAALENARDVLRSLSQDAQNDLVVLSSLGGVYNNLGMAYEHTKNYTPAIDAYEQAIAHQRSALSRAPKMATFAGFLDRTYQNYARVLDAAGRTEDAAKARGQLGTRLSP